MKAWLDEINRLAEEISSHWKSSSYDPRKFADFAAASLSASRIETLFSPALLVQLFNQKGKFTSLFPPGQVSSVPITTHRNERFFIDLYLWHSFDTVIHNHHFTGAFKCLFGMNHELTFSFQEGEKLHPLVSKGDLVCHGQKKIAPGDVQKILANDQSIHSLVHTAPVTANLCVRTYPLPDLTLGTYYIDGLRVIDDPALLRLQSLEKLTGIFLKEGLVTSEDEQDIYENMDLRELIYVASNCQNKEKALSLLKSRHQLDMSEILKRQHLYFTKINKSLRTDYLG